MQIGLIGCGNMARALARGWGRPVLCADPVGQRARDLAAEVGGEALDGNAAVAERADVVVLCHKPAQLRSVAEEVAPKAAAVASILAATSLATPNQRHCSCTATARWVLRTEATTVSSSRGRRLRRSMTSASMPSSASRSAAARHRAACRP